VKRGIVRKNVFDVWLVILTGCYGRLEIGEEPLVKTAAKIFQDLCYNYRDSMSAGIICAGWDRKEGPQVFCFWLSVSSFVRM